MTEYTIIYDNGNDDRVYSLTECKKIMKATGARAFKTKIYSNGDFIFCGEVVTKGSNKSFIANKMTKPNY